jgi:molecular chaperone DnaK
LLDRRKRAQLGPQETEVIVKAFLDVRGFEVASPWVAFFEQLPQDQLPHIHQVYALLSRFREAADLAEEQGDFRSALRYLLESPGLEAARRAITLSEERLRDSGSAVQAHRRAAEAFCHQGDYLSAAEHFKRAGDAERLSDCYLNAGRIADAIKSRPGISSAWLAVAREKTDDAVRQFGRKGDSLEAIRFIRDVVDSLGSKGDEECLHIEALRLEEILSSMVRTARASLTQEARGAAVTAALMFEKAGAYGQALRAFERSPRGDQVERKAMLLEHGGDFFMAGLLYESLGQTEKAVTMFEQSGDFSRAAGLLRERLGDDKAAFDDRYLKMVTAAGRAEDVAQLCWGSAGNRSPSERGRFLKRIKQLVDGGYVAGVWSERVSQVMAELDESDRSAFTRRAAEWADRATNYFRNR